MVDSPRHPGTDDDTGAGPDRGSSPRTPRWVRVFGIVVAVLVLVIVAMMVIGDGEHGPGRHTSSPDREALTTVTADLTPSGGGLEGYEPSGTSD